MDMSDYCEAQVKMRMQNRVEIIFGETCNDRKQVQRAREESYMKYAYVKKDCYCTLREKYYEIRDSKTPCWIEIDHPCAKCGCKFIVNLLKRTTKKPRGWSNRI